MLNVWSLSVIAVLCASGLCREEVDDQDIGQVDKRRLPDKFERSRWTTTTAKPDEVYIEPLGDIKDLCIKMIERYHYGEGGYVWRPYNSRFYGELRWKKQNTNPDIDDGVRF